jgi:hypothetical protein
VVKNYDTQRTAFSSYSVCGSDDKVIPNPKSLTCHEDVSVKKSVAAAQASNMLVYEWLKPNQRLVQPGGIPMSLVGQKCMVYLGTPFSPTFLNPAIQKLWMPAGEARFTILCSKKLVLPLTRHFDFDKTAPVGFDLGGIGNFTYTIDSTVTPEASKQDSNRHETSTGEVGAICSL